MDQVQAHSMISHPLRQPVLSSHIERFVGNHLGHSWHITCFENLDDFASHPCALLSDGRYSVFAKFSHAANALDQFETELNSLKLLADLSGVAIPPPIGVVVAEEGVVLLLEAVAAVDRTAQHWRHMGQALARIHRVKGQQFGLHTHGYFGPIYQDNRPVIGNDWVTFYAERRLWPRLIGAIDSGHLPTKVARKVEKLMARLPNLCGPAIQPTLIHGDAQKNNFISTPTQAVVIDSSSVHFGHPEIDLAYMDYFEPVPQDVFEGYAEVLPIDPGFAERRNLWRVSGYLAVVSNGGPKYVSWLVNAVDPYL
jgi:protein-ribulosamine 3-kinase